MHLVHYFCAQREMHLVHYFCNTVPILDASCRSVNQGMIGVQVSKAQAAKNEPGDMYKAGNIPCNILLASYTSPGSFLAACALLTCTPSRQIKMST